MSTLNAAYWHALNILNIGSLWKFWEISKNFSNIQRMYEASAHELLKLGANPQAVDKLCIGRRKIDPVQEMNKITRAGIQILTRHDSDYPERLQHIHSSPPLIYVRGNAKCLKSESLAFVGSRKISSYGKNIIKQLVPSICELDVSIVSGMAYGVDAVSLETCLEHGGTPIAVLASSLSYEEIAPKAHLDLARQIEQAGCLISENPPGSFIGKMHFPLRNRIISGLSLGIVVVEAGLKSGSLITAKYGLDHGKEVFAVPGTIFSPNSEGTLELIKRGARCVTSAKDITQEFGWDTRINKNVLNLTSPVHQKIMDCLSVGYNNIDAILENTTLTSNQILSGITELEIMGALQRSGNGVYHKTR